MDYHSSSPGVTVGTYDSRYGSSDDDGIKYAGFWKRLAAYIIDAIIIGFASFIASFVVIFIAFMLGRSTGLAAAILCLYYLCALAGVILYHVLSESGPNMGTPGKSIMGIAIVDTDYDRISAGRSFIRYILKNIVISVIPSVISLVVMLGAFFIIGFNSGDAGSLAAFRWAMLISMTLSMALTFVYNIIIVAFIGYSQRKQAPYDMLARTLVVEKSSLP